MDIFDFNEKNANRVKIVLVNLVPIFGVLFFGWSLFLIFFYYWLENCLIGLVNIVEILIVSFWQRKILTGFGAVIFFCLHFGGFMVGHLFLLIHFFADNDPIFVRFDRPSLSLVWFLFLNFIPVLLSYFFSFISFCRSKNKTTKIQQLLFLPYPRLLTVHFTFFIGGLIAYWLGAPAVSLIILILFKSVFERLSQEITPPSPPSLGASAVARAMADKTEGHGQPSLCSRGC